MAKRKHPIRIVFYSNCLGRGGAHQSMLAWLELLRDDPAFELKVLCAETGWFTRQLDRIGVGFELLPMPRALGQIKHGQWQDRVDTAWRVLSMAGGLARAWLRVATVPADAVVLTGGRDFIMLLPLAVRRRRHTVTIPQTTDWAEIPTCRLMCQVAARTYAISARVADSIEAMGIPRTKISVQPLIYTSDFHGTLRDKRAARNALGLPHDAVLLGMTGLIRRHKGQKEAVRILEQVLPRVPMARLVVAGTPGESPDAQAYHRELLSLIDQRGLADKVLMLGWRDDVPQIMRALDVLLVPSHDFEGVPRVILEGLEAGLPIVASDLPQFREVLGQHGAGILHPVTEPARWAEDIVSLTSAPDRLAAASRHARQVWQDNFSREGVGPTIREAFASVAG